jgi:hypothetical protein
MLSLPALTLTFSLAGALVYSGDTGDLNVAIPRIEDPDVRIDGKLEEATWRQAARLVNFTQYDPVEGIPATEPTEILVFYTSDAIYFGIRARDSKPEQINARLVQRDRSAFSDDWVRITLDTFNDQRRAYVFYVNPFGIQTDGLWIEGLRSRGGMASIDYNPDFIWDSDGRLTEDGWTAEVRIPYVSMRFRPVEVQDWGVNVAREVRRTGFKQSWAPLTRDMSNTLAQSGRLVGLRGLRPRRLQEINPVVTGKRVGYREDDVFVQEDFDPEFGVNGRYGITQNLVLDATYNPDFSHVEADAFQLTTNERFAIYLPEKRPFFLEGTEVFESPKRLVYTRRVLDPIGGAKLTGKMGPFSLGYLGTVDEGPVTTGAGEHNALFNFFRVKMDVGDAGSTVGALLTDRTELGGSDYNRVLGSDFRWVFRGRYTWTTQFAGSWTADVAGGQARPLFTTNLQRSGRKFSWQVRFEDIHPDFRARSGYIRRFGEVQIFGTTRFTFYGKPGALLERVGVGINGDSYFDHHEFWNRTAGPYEGEVEIHPSFTFRGDRSLSFIYRDGYFRFRPEDYDNYEVETEDGSVVPFQVPEPLEHLLAFAVIPRFRITNEVRTNARFYFREVPIYSEASRGFEFQFAPGLNLRPTTALSFDFNYTYSKITRRNNDSVYSITHIPRFKLQYQFSKALMARAIVQYNLLERDVLRDPATGQPLVIYGTPSEAVDRGTFEGQFLVSYEPSPRTIFYVGYSFVRRGYTTYDFSSMEPMADGLFVKLSYLFRI